jgi:hypothetical protein
VNDQRPDEWVFELRKDAQWSDGKPLTAEDFLFSFRRLLTPALASDYSFMLYYIKDAEFYHKSQRSYLLSRNEANFSKEWWSSLKEVDFGPNEQAKEGSFNFIGLDKLNLSQLERLLKEPDLFKWPKNVSREIRRDLLMKNLNYEKDNRGKLAKEELKDLWELIEFGATAPDPHTLRIKLNSPLPFPAGDHQALHLVSGAPARRPQARQDRRPASPTGRSRKIWSATGLSSSSPGSFNDHIEVVPATRIIGTRHRSALNGVRYLPISNLYTEATGCITTGRCTSPTRIAPGTDRVHSRQNYP